MPRKPSVTVQMTEDPSDLDKLLSAAVNPGAPPPRRPPPEPSPPPDEPPPMPDPDDEPPEEDPDGDEDEPHIAAETFTPTPALTPPPPAPDKRSRAARLVEGKPPPPADRRYESRITIIDAYQYPGNVAAAPAWVDRNWVAWADEDQLRQIPAGPALRVPTHFTSTGEDVLCRVGDYVARQEVRLLANEPGEIKLEVWAKEQFERIFLPA